MVVVGKQSARIGSGGRSRPCWTMGLFSGEIASSVTRSFFLRCGGVLYIGVYVRGLLSGNRFDEAMQRSLSAKQINRLYLEKSGLFAWTIERTLVTRGIRLIFPAWGCTLRFEPENTSVDQWTSGLQLFYFWREERFYSGDEIISIQTWKLRDNWNLQKENKPRQQSKKKKRHKRKSHKIPSQTLHLTTCFLPPTKDNTPPSLPK